MYRPGGGFGFLPPVIKNLIIINAIVYLLTGFLKPEIGNYLALYPFGSGAFQPYQLVSYMFTHGGFFHFFFNMFSLWMFGSAIENQWGPKKFLLFYLVCGLGAALVHLFVEGYLLHSFAPMVGASGAIYGVLIAYGFMYPNNRLMLLFPPIPMKAKFFVIMLVAIDLFAAFSARDNIAHFAHIGGALVGFVILLVWRAQHKLY